MWFENVRNAFRGLRSAPGFTITAVVSLSIGSGGSVAMFTLVNSILLKPLGYADAGRLVRVTNAEQKSLAPDLGVLPLEFTRWRRQVQSLESIGLAANSTHANLTGIGQPEVVTVSRISAGFFETLRNQPQLGRWFLEAEEKRGAPNVVVLSDSLWRRAFSARPDIIGSTIRIGDSPYEVVGVTPPHQRFLRNQELHRIVMMAERADIFTPIRFTAAELRGSLATPAGYVAIARLKAGITPGQLQAELDATLPSIREYQADFATLQTRTDVRELRTAMVEDSRKGLLLLQLSVGMLLLIGCANVANLSLVRATQRSRELAVRTALGASRGALIRDSLAESFLIAAGSMAAGWLLSLWIRDLAISRAPFLPRTEEIVTDATVFGFAVGICVVTAVLFGLQPAWRASRSDPQQLLNNAARGNTESIRGGRVRAAVIAAEVALGTVLVIGSGLLLVSFHRVMTNPRGFDGRDVLISDLYLPASRYAALDKQLSFFRAVHDDLVSLPGVMRVAANTRPPLDGEPIYPVRVEGEVKALSEIPTACWPNVTVEYFAAMKIPLRAGRLFRDAGETEPVALVSESAARSIWPGQDPIGRRVSKFVEAEDDYSRVIGVVADVLSGALDRPPTPTVYRPYTQRGGRNTAFSIVIQTTLAPRDLAAPYRAVVSRFDSDLPVTELRPMPDLIADSVQVRLFQVSLLGAFAIVAVLLAAVGIYGVVAHSALQRRKEIGIRIALGAAAEDISRLVMRNGMTPVLAGLAVGLAVAASLTKVIASLLFQVGTLDPFAFFAAPSIFILVAALPCWWTARHAAQADPMDALRLD
jgi:putative ABC transport system permease protein